MSLLRAIESTLESSGVTAAAVGNLEMVDRHDGTVEVWPTAPASALPELGRRRAILAGCLSSLQKAGLRVELVCRGETFIRCRA